MWTKENIKQLMKLWDDNTLEEIANEMGLQTGQVQYMAHAIRKMGYVITRKHVRGRIKSTIEDAMQELGFKKLK